MLTRGALFRYGILGVPLAFAGLPVYVHVPKFYTDTQGVSIAKLGVLLLCLRLLDAFIDPLIGVASDKFRKHSRLLMAAFVPVLLIGYVALFTPPAGMQPYALEWLGIWLAVVYFSFSALMINFYAMGVDMGKDYHDHTRIAAFREGSMLIGVLLASILPTLLLSRYEPIQAYHYFSLLLVPLLVLCAVLCLTNAKHFPRAAHSGQSHSFWGLLKSPSVRWVLFIGFCNAIPTAITSTLFLFFTSDVLQAEKYSGPLLAVYFISAAAGMPFWTWLSKRYGKRKSLLSAMVVAIICFIWAWQLTHGDLIPFLIICILSGLTLGADSMLLPSMLADALSDKRDASATAFGLWNLTSKLTMAMAAGLALPLLAAGGYEPGAGPLASDAALARLSFCYGLLPCLFKAVAVAMLYLSPLDKRNA